MKKKNIIKLTFIGLFILLIIIFSILKSIPQCADFYALHIFSSYEKFIGVLTKNLSFSLFEILFILLVAFLLFLFIRIFTGIKKHKWFTRLLSLIMVITFTAAYYLGTAGVCYGRSEFKYKELSNEEITSSIIDEALAYYINEYNTLGDSFDRDNNNQIIIPYSTKKLSVIINNEYDRLNQIDGYGNTYSPVCKELISSSLFSEMQITGITMGITGEPNINKNMPKAEFIFTIAHEIAHTKGIYREADANLASLIVCMNSENTYLRYSALYYSISSLMEAYNLTFRSDYSLKYPLSNTIIKEWSYNYKYWKTHDLLGTITDKWNTFYLKLNGSKKGTADYVDETEKVDTGETDDNGNTIYEITSYSPYQRYLYYLYVNKN